MARWHNPYGRCAICGSELDEGEGPIYTVYHESCLPPCELCGHDIRADLCGACTVQSAENGQRGIKGRALINPSASFGPLGALNDQAAHELRPCGRKPGEHAVIV